MVKSNEISRHQNVLKGLRSKIIYKGRLVVRGFEDINSHHLSETYVPIARMTDVRFLSAVANKFDLEIHQLDVKKVKEIYIKFSEGFRLTEQTDSHVCKSQKALYGLKVSPKRG